MEEKPIKDIPSLKKLREDAHNFSVLNKGWPLIRPLFKVLGVDVKKIDEALKQAAPLVAKTDELTSLPDNFNNLFSDKGWIMYSWMNIDIAKKAVELGKLGQFDEAENILIEYYSTEELQRELRLMIAVEAFRDRIPLAEKALHDFTEERFYSSTLVVLSLLDGMVNEIQRKGFFSKNVDLTAWDSMTAHSKGLQKLVSVLSQSRTKTVTQSINIPYRHGILHGMDLGYDNRTVAIKAWVALFATRDWAIKAERNQLEAPPQKPEKTWKEVLGQLQDLERDKEAIANWQPRNIKVGTNCPLSGEPGDYDDNTPEQKLVEFLSYWKTKNYGYMAKCILTEIGDPIKVFPLRIREEYYGKQLNTWQLSNILDEAPAITVITIQVNYEENGLTNTKSLQARIICQDDLNIGVIRGKPGARWALVSWHLKEINQNNCASDDSRGSN
jgi:hypothetical protein